jgi:hypothetical protein
MKKLQTLKICVWKHRNIFIGQNEKYLFCGNVYRYRNFAAFKDLFSDKGFPFWKQLGLGWPCHVCFLYWHVRFKQYGIQIILCFCLLSCIENWISKCPLIIKLFLHLWVLYCLNIAGNGIYGCSQGIHFDQWQCNGDRLFQVWVTAVCAREVKAKLGKLI